MKEVTILVGNIASGKSTYLKHLNYKALVISKYESRKAFAYWLNLEYLFDNKLEKSIKIIIQETFTACLRLGIPRIFLDETNMTVKRRSFYINEAKKYGYEVNCVCFSSVGMYTHVQRRLENNHGDISKEVWENVYSGLL